MPKSCLRDLLPGSKYGISPTPTARFPLRGPNPSWSPVAVWNTLRLSQIAVTASQLSVSAETRNGAETLTNVIRTIPFESDLKVMSAGNHIMEPLQQVGALLASQPINLCGKRAYVVASQNRTSLH
jgi:hypothetical protein